MNKSKRANEKWCCSAKCIYKIDVGQEVRIDLMQFSGSFARRWARKRWNSNGWTERGQLVDSIYLFLVWKWQWNHYTLKVHAALDHTTAFSVPRLFFTNESKFNCQFFVFHAIFLTKIKHISNNIHFNTYSFSVRATWIFYNGN